MILCIHNLAHFKQALLEHLVFFFQRLVIFLQRFQRLGQLVQSFLLLAGFLLLFFALRQLLRRVADVPLDGQLLGPRRR